MFSKYNKKQKIATFFFTILFISYSLPSLSNTELNEKKYQKQKITKNINYAKNNELDEDDDDDNNPFSFNFDLDLGRFIWKGISLSRGQVLTPSTTISLFNIELSSNAYFFLGNEPFAGSLNFSPAQYKIPEVDVSLGYKNLKFWNLSVKPSTEFYFYPLGSDPATGVLNLEFSYPIWMVNLISSHSFIFLGFPGVYYSDFGISYENVFFDNFVLSSSVKVDITSNEFNNRFLNINKTSLSTFESNLSLSYNFKNFYIKPHVEFSSVIDPDLRKLPNFANRQQNNTTSNQPSNNTAIPNGTNPRANNNNFMRRLAEFDIFNLGVSIGFDY